MCLSEETLHRCLLVNLLEGWSAFPGSDLQVNFDGKTLIGLFSQTNSSDLTTLVSTISPGLKYYHHRRRRRRFGWRCTVQGGRLSNRMVSISGVCIPPRASVCPYRLSFSNKYISQALRSKVRKTTTTKTCGSILARDPVSARAAYIAHVMLLELVARLRVQHNRFNYGPRDRVTTASSPSPSSWWMHHFNQRFYQFK